MTTRHGIFVTGGSGFIGRRLLAALQQTGRPIQALRRPGPSGPTGVSEITGDLLQPETYRNALRTCDVVLHLAAATGRASAEEHARVNAHGTEVLLDECRRAGVTRLLFVSSIATTFADQTGYHYALAKGRAEQTVGRSGLRFAILRPTIILGPGAPLLQSLEKLALLPFVTVPGSGRARVQPIHVDDVVKSILAIVRDDLFANETFEIGGPDVVSMDELLQALRQARTGTAGRVLHVPLLLLTPPLRLAEAAGLARLLPITAGQLSSFRFDGVAAANRLQQRVGATGLVSLDEMLAPAPAPVLQLAPTHVVPDAAILDAECRVFTRHLLGCDPDDYILVKYRAAHDVLPALASTSRFDDVLLACARAHPLGAKIADAHAALFAPASALRKRLVLLLAILETRPPFHQRIDAGVGGSTPAVIARLGLRLLGAVLGLIVGTLVLLPTRVVLAVAGKAGR